MNNFDSIAERFMRKQKEFNEKYPTEKDKLIYYILESCNVNNLTKEELYTWNEEDLNNYLGLCELIEDERLMIEDGIHWSQMSDRKE